MPTEICVHVFGSAQLASSVRRITCILMSLFLTLPVTSCGPEWPTNTASNYWRVDSDRAAEELLQVSPVPKYVTVAGPSVTDEGLGMVFAVPGLRRLALRGCTGITSLEGMKLAPSLISLDVVNCPNLDRSSWVYVSEQPALESLLVSEWPLSSGDLRNLCGSPSLQTFDYFDESLPDVDWLEGLQVGPQLMTLDLRGCPNVSTDDLDRLISPPKRLRIVVR